MNSVKTLGLSLPSGAIGKTGAAGAKGLAANHSPQAADDTEDAFRDALERAMAPKAQSDAEKGSTGAAGKALSSLADLSAADLPSLVEKPGTDSRDGSKSTSKSTSQSPDAPSSASIAASLPMPDLSHNEVPKQAVASEGGKHAASEQAGQHASSSQTSANTKPSTSSGSGTAVLASTGEVRTAGDSVSATGFAAVLDSHDLHPILQQAQEDSSLRVNISSQGAQLSLDTGANGALFAQLHVVNGIADVRINGEGASDLVRHSAELSLGLTAAGLQPGRLEISTSASTDSRSMGSEGQHSSQQGESGAGQGSNDSRQSWLQAEPSDASPTVATSAAARLGGVHVKV